MPATAVAPPTALLPSGAVVLDPSSWDDPSCPSYPSTTSSSSSSSPSSSSPPSSSSSLYKPNLPPLPSSVSSSADLTFKLPPPSRTSEPFRDFRGQFTLHRTFLLIWVTLVISTLLFLQDLVFPPHPERHAEPPLWWARDWIGHLLITPLFFYVVSFVGALIYRGDGGSGLNSGSKYVDLDDVPATTAQKVVWRIVTRGLNKSCIDATIAKIRMEMNRNSLFPYLIEVVTDTDRYTPERADDIVHTNVPLDYNTPNSTKFKARALHYACVMSPVPDDAWVVHLDEETRPTSSGVKGIAQFIQEAAALDGEGGGDGDGDGDGDGSGDDVHQHQHHTTINLGDFNASGERKRLHTLPTTNNTNNNNNNINNKNNNVAKRRPKLIGQGCMLYHRSWNRFPLLTLADMRRTGDDYGQFYLQARLGVANVGLHGAFIVMRVRDEKSLGFDIGPDGSITEDAWWVFLAMQHGFRLRWVHGFLEEQATESIADFVKQRRRWMYGLQKVMWLNPCYVRYRLVFVAFMAVWLLAPVLAPMQLLYVAALVWHDVGVQTYVRVLSLFNVAMIGYAYVVGWVVSLREGLHEQFDIPATTATTVGTVDDGGVVQNGGKMQTGMKDDLTMTERERWVRKWCRIVGWTVLLCAMIPMFQILEGVALMLSFTARFSKVGRGFHVVEKSVFNVVSAMDRVGK